MENDLKPYIRPFYQTARVSKHTARPTTYFISFSLLQTKFSKILQSRIFLIERSELELKY